MQTAAPTSPKPRPAVAVLGECMVQIKPAPGAAFAAPTLPATLGFGGDTLNFALYLARLGQAVEYITALGGGALSAWLLREWRREGIGTTHVQQIQGAAPGLYLITTDAGGERHFTYWREQAPVRQMLNNPQPVFNALQSYKWLYLSGITLALFAPPVRAQLLEFLARYRAGGGRMAFDSNFRPQLWPAPAEAQAAFNAAYAECDAALVTAEDERALFGAGLSDREIIARLQGLGAREVALKLGARGCLVAGADGRVHACAARRVARVTDTTAAGDSFNAGYLAARLRGESCTAAGAAGNRLAARVVQHPGAIIPREAMPA